MFLWIFLLTLAKDLVMYINMTIEEISEEITKGYEVVFSSYTTINISDIQQTLDRLWPLEGYLPEIVYNATLEYQTKLYESIELCELKGERLIIKWADGRCAEEKAKLDAANQLCKSLAGAISALQSRLK